MGNESVANDMNLAPGLNVDLDADLDGDLDADLDADLGADLEAELDVETNVSAEANSWPGAERDRLVSAAVREAPTDMTGASRMAPPPSQSSAMGDSTIPPASVRVSAAQYTFHSARPGKRVAACAENGSNGGSKWARFLNPATDADSDSD